MVVGDAVKTSPRVDKLQQSLLGKVVQPLFGKGAVRDEHDAGPETILSVTPDKAPATTSILFQRVDSLRSSKEKQTKSGPAARQRILPQDLAYTATLVKAINSTTTTTTSAIGERTPTTPEQSPQKKKDIVFTFTEGFQPSVRPKSLGIAKSDEWLNSVTAKEDSDLRRSREKSPRNEVNTINESLSSAKRRLVEKSQSFRVFTNNSSHGSSKRRDGSAEKDIPEYTAARKDSMDKPVVYKDFVKETTTSPIRCYPSSGSNVSLSSSPPTSMKSSNNIIQIEENIDKLVSLPFVSVLAKKSSLLSPVITRDPFKCKSNISITTIRNEPIDQKSPTKTAISNSTDSYFSVDPPTVAASSSPPINILPNVRKMSASLMEKSPSVGSLNTLGHSSVPEFMKVHLNRVDHSGRPKSTLVLFKSSPPPTRDCDTLPRRFSRELDSPTTSIKPPLPATLKRASINKSQETITESNPVILVPAQPIRKTVSVDGPAEPQEQAVVAKRQFADVLLNNNNNNNSNNHCRDVEPVELLERKGSVSEEKAKIERRLSIVDDKVVIIRKKSLSNTINIARNSSAKEDKDTPELMKVFARRSLKLKDDDEDVLKNEIASAMIMKQNNNNSNNNNHNNNNNSSTTADSDKENNSNSGSGVVALVPQKVLKEAALITATKECAKPPLEPLIVPSSVNLRPRSTFSDVKRNIMSMPPSPAANQLPQQQRNVEKSMTRTSIDQHHNHNNRNHDIRMLATESSSGPVEHDVDKMPEFKRILERRAEWEKRAKMCK